jgi:hypothetical protein
VLAKRGEHRLKRPRLVRKGTVDAAYDPAKERIRVATYVTDKTLARVK